MRIILLSGRGKAGKTTTFHKIYDLLTRGMNPLPAKTPIRNGNTTGDFESEFLYKETQIALYSAGDYMIDDVVLAIVKYSHVGCLVLAHSNDGAERKKISAALAAFQSPPQSHRLVAKTVCGPNAGLAAEDAANAADAATVVSLI